MLISFPKIKRQLYTLLSVTLLFSITFTVNNVFAADDQRLSSAHNSQLTLQNVSIGALEEEVIATFGVPQRTDLSEYGFEWYIYNEDYTRYVQVGIENGKVVALYTNAIDWSLVNGIGFESTKEEIEQVFGEPLTHIKKGNTLFNYQDSGKEYGLYFLNGVYVTIFYDLHQNNQVTAIQLVEAATELSFKNFYGEPSERLRESFERQLFDLTNTVRTRSGMEPLEWDEEVASTARNHSIDMANRSFFNHMNLEGQSPFDRMKKDGIVYTLASENIAAGHTSAIFAHEGWMNSKGHRQNILGDYNHLGVGISFGGDFQIYYTQNFYQSE